MLPLRRAKSTTSNYNCHQGATSYRTAATSTSDTLRKTRFKAKITTQSVSQWMLFWKSKEDSHLRGSGQFQVVDHRSFMQEHAVLRPDYTIV